MGRADRLRERFENERLRNVIVVPMFAPPRDAAAIRTFALGLKPAAQLAVEDTDVLRVHIATETRRPPRKSKLLNNTVLSRWAGMRFEDDTNKRQLVGVVQVSNAVLEHTKGAAGGRRMFLDEDQEVRGQRGHRHTLHRHPAPCASISGTSVLAHLKCIRRTFPCARSVVYCFPMRWQCPVLGSTPPT